MAWIRKAVHKYLNVGTDRSEQTVQTQIRLVKRNNQDLHCLPFHLHLLTHCILVDSSTVICWTSPFVILGVSGLFVTFILLFMENPVSNSVDPDQMPHYVASDLGLHCLPMTCFQVSQQEWVKTQYC